MASKPHLQIVPTPAEARAIAKDAYIYGYPMVQTYLTMYAFSIDKHNPQYKGPFNAPLSFARVFTPDDSAFVTPNSDTPYTFLSLDLRAEPMVLTVPAVEKNRYWVFQMMDLYSFNFDYLGTRATGRMVGEWPSLTSLDANGNQRENVDFRGVYCSLLEQWFDHDAAAVIPEAGRFARYPLIA